MSIEIPQNLKCSSLGAPDVPVDAAHLSSSSLNSVTVVQGPCSSGKSLFVKQIRESGSYETTTVLTCSSSHNHQLPFANVFDAEHWLEFLVYVRNFVREKSEGVHFVLIDDIHCFSEPRRSVILEEIQKTANQNLKVFVTTQI